MLSVATFKMCVVAWHIVPSSKAAKQTWQVETKQPRAREHQLRVLAKMMLVVLAFLAHWKSRDREDCHQCSFCNDEQSENSQRAPDSSKQIAERWVDIHRLRSSSLPPWQPMARNRQVGLNLAEQAPCVAASPKIMSMSPLSILKLHVWRSRILPLRSPMTSCLLSDVTAKWTQAWRQTGCWLQVHTTLLLTHARVSLNKSWLLERIQREKTLVWGRHEVNLHCQWSCLQVRKTFRSPQKPNGGSYGMCHSKAGDVSTSSKKQGVNGTKRIKGVDACLLLCLPLLDLIALARIVDCSSYVGKAATIIFALSCVRVCVCARGLEAN
jgi:hypothetical protein